MGATPGLAAREEGVPDPAGATPGFTEAGVAFEVGWVAAGAVAGAALPLGRAWAAPAGTVAGRAGGAVAVAIGAVRCAEAAGRDGFDFAAAAFTFSASAAASCAARPKKCFRTSSAWELSIELECVFFSVTPTSGRYSIRTFALISSSLASSLIRT